MVWIFTISSNAILEKANSCWTILWEQNVAIFGMLLMPGLHLNYGEKESIQSNALSVSDVGCNIDMGDNLELYGEGVSPSGDSSTGCFMDLW